MSQSKLPVSKSRSPPVSLEISGAPGARSKDKKKVKAKSGDSCSTATRNKIFSKKKGFDPLWSLGPYLLKNRSPSERGSFNP
ncbi:hypothetical protein V1264_014431 [Littorina saxatilis]|uniref:Uncharacterized protein n=1 Tax=Littorina saxatilis TaxID=31220 RepID=A0AAN9GL04_9CAEN